MNLKIIYEPQGRAAEYADLALNIYKGCAHGCRYCFNFNTRWAKEGYFKGPDPKGNIVSLVVQDAEALAEAGDDREILLSFVGDVYQPAEEVMGSTRRVIQILIEHELRFTILTKGGLLATRDFHLLAGYEKCSFGVSLMCVEDRFRQLWEPMAASVEDRITSLKIAKQMGIKTWMSIEPVIHPGQALALISEHGGMVDKIKVGKINHNKDLESSVDWIYFRSEVKKLLKLVSRNYYIKNSLADL